MVDTYVTSTAKQTATPKPKKVAETCTENQQKPDSKKPTLQDVAKAAHVAESTASRALNQLAGTNKLTTNYVQKIAAEIGYVSPRDGWIPPPKPTNCIGFMPEPRRDELLWTVQKQAIATGYSLTILPPITGTITELQAIAKQFSTVDGLILNSCPLKDSTLYKMRQGSALIVTNRLVKNTTCVIPNVETGITQAISHLHALGHWEITYLHPKQNNWLSQHCLRQINLTCQKLGITLRIIPDIENSPAGGAQALTTWKKYFTSAVISFGTNIAHGFLQATQQIKICIPTDIALLAIGNSCCSAFTTPALTVLENDLETIGTEAVKQLIHQIEHPENNSNTIISIPMRLIIRDST